MLLIESYYQKNRERLKTGAVNIGALQRQVGSWIEPRKAMIQLDKNIPVLAEKNLPDEIRETLAELEAWGTSAYSLFALLTETMDISFFPLASSVSNNVMLDSYQILPYVNGVGSKDTIFDKMTETAGNITKKNLDRDLHEFFRYYVAFVAGLPEMFSLEQMMSAVLDKNAKNYPDQFFNGVHPELKRKLNPDELIAQYKHARLCLKMIRLVHRQLLQNRDRDYGLQKEDWQPYSQHLLDFEHSELQLTSLALKLTADAHLTPQQSEKVFAIFLGSATVQPEQRKAA